MSAVQRCEHFIETLGILKRMEGLCHTRDDGGLAVHRGCLALLGVDGFCDALNSFLHRVGGLGCHVRHCSLHAHGNMLDCVADLKLCAAVRQCAAYNATIPRGTIQARHLSGYFMSFSALICGMSCTITPHNRRRGCRMVLGGQVRVNALTPMQWWTKNLPQCHHCYESPCCEASAEQTLQQNGASTGGSVSEAGGCAKGGQLSACYLVSSQDRISNQMESCVMMSAARKSAAPVPLDSFASDRSLAAPFHFSSQALLAGGTLDRSAREFRISTVGSSTSPCSGATPTEASM